MAIHVALSPRRAPKRRRRLVSKYQGRRLSFSDADEDVFSNLSSEVKLLLNSLDKFEKLWMEHQMRLKSTPAALKEEWDNKIRILMSMRWSLIFGRIEMNNSLVGWDFEFFYHDYDCEFHDVKAFCSVFNLILVVFFMIVYWNTVYGRVINC